MNYKALLRGARLFEGTPVEGTPEFEDHYEKFVLDRRQIWEELDRVTESDVRETMIEFLKRWKIRNVNRIIPSKLKEVLRGLNKHFKALRITNKSLVNLDFNEAINIEGQRKKISGIIKEIYKRLVEINGVGPTAASKIMHGIIPSLFMMWDEKIRKGYGYADNEIGYLKFMRESQRILKSIVKSYGKSPEELCREASPTPNKTLTKLLDEFNFMKFSRGENLPNPTQDCC